MALVLIVEDENLLRWSLDQRIARIGHTVHTAENLAQAAQHLQDHKPDVLLLDLSLPDGHGLDFFEGHLGELEDTVVLVMTAVGQVEDAVRAMKLGAMDFLTKPVDHGELTNLIERSVAARADRLEATAARTQRERSLEKDIVANSAAFRRTLDFATQVAQSEITSILIEGESGTGKNVLARYIHAASTRHRRPILEVNCAALPENLLESELFGHEKGAFTDAKTAKQGTVELADGGAVVLDEIGELRLEVQAKLLHFLENRRFRRVGGTREIQVDVRVMALTNRSLQTMVNERAFRSDLYFRLSVFPLVVPPLRERREDILPLARSFQEALRPKFRKNIAGFTREAENVLLAYAWPGNVRELRNVVERAMLLEPGQHITPHSLVLDAAGPAVAPVTEPSSGVPGRIVPLRELESEMVRRAMDATGGNQTRAAELLGITRDQLRYRLKRGVEDAQTDGPQAED